MPGDTQNTALSTAVLRREGRLAAVSGATNTSFRSSPRKIETLSPFLRRGLIPNPAGFMVTRIGKSVPEGFKVVARLGKFVRSQPCRFVTW